MRLPIVTLLSAILGVAISVVIVWVIDPIPGYWPWLVDSIKAHLFP